ncbi:hypothetical protein BDA99DRAFT_497447 [Phascolomyces articulosus]|uniref:BZIP domain-containing protein n=1 Tax=Phascolomyces articulosus TaxID=60185 RepID=A0AAD5K8F0_9FUNG|nr:hypothetical protein BDA99DRAFT_497447 [Phascolomyces articulosus]
MLTSMSKPDSFENMQLPMAISTITSSNTSGENMSSSSSSCSSSPIISSPHQYHPDTSSHIQNLRDKIHSFPSSSGREGARRNSHSIRTISQQQDYLYSPYLDERRISSTSPPPSSSSSSIPLPLTAPLSLQERRERNKAASAKYRAKKNQQHGEMKSVITSLTRENELLQRQLEHIRHENNQLKETCDQLRGKLMAQKMIKRMMDEDRCDIRDLKATFDLEGEHHDKDEDMVL